MPYQGDLIRLSATEAVDLLKSREVSPLDLIEAAARRIEDLDGKINALPLRFFDRARDAAKRLPSKLAERSSPPGWLAGLPIAVKDYNDVAGQTTTYGSPIFKNNIPACSDTTVLILEASGAIPIAKSNVPEFAGANTFNSVYGATRNPWNLERSAGGSSGGAAAALAAGMVWLATGNDLGGSLRIPASFCGIVGLRPSVGRVPRPSANPPFDALWVEGPMGRTVSDVALMLDAEAKQTIGDPWSRPRPEKPFVEATKTLNAPRRVGFSSNLALSKIDPEIATICRKATESLRSAAVDVDEVCPDLSGGIEAFQTLRALMFASVRGELVRTHRGQIAPEIVWNLEKGLSLTADEILRAERIRARLYGNMVDFFNRFDVLACPTVAVAPFPVEQRYPTEIAGEKLETYIDWMFLTFVVTLTGCPAISVPCGFTATGLPVGLQLIGRPHGDYELLAAAAVLEQTCGYIGKRLPVG
ncbi:MAG: amidase [Acidobacteria bacterium]|nr:amidase [Acidobacteriota bacterium]